MSLLEEVTSEPIQPDGWNIGSLGPLGVLISCKGFSVRLDPENLNSFFDFIEDEVQGEFKDTDGRTIQVFPNIVSGVRIGIKGDKVSPAGYLLNTEALRELGIEEYDLEEPSFEDDESSSDDTITSEGIKTAYRRSGKKIKRGFRVTSGFRKGRVLSSAKSAFKPRIKASTRMKLSIAGKKKKFIRLLKGKMTRRKSSSKRLVRMNKGLK